MTKDEIAYVLWHVTVLGLLAVGAQLGLLQPLLENGREAIVAVIGGLYLLSLALSSRLLWRMAREGVDEVPALHRRLKGIDLVSRLVAMIGLGMVVTAIFL